MRILRRSNYYAAAIPLGGRIDHTDEYVCYSNKCQRWGGGCEYSLPAKTVSCRNGDLTSGSKMAQIDRFRAIWLRVIIVTGLHTRKT